MRAIVQRVARAEVRVGGEIVGRAGFTGLGLLVLVGIGKDDTPASGEWLAEKIVNLRILDDEQGEMNRSLSESGGSVLCVSQFTLFGDCRKGRRPNYARAAPPQVARPLYEGFLESLCSLLPTAPGGASRVEAGEFQARMEVELVNSGPVTLLLDSERQD